MKKKKINFSFILIILLGLIVSCSVYLLLNMDKIEVLVTTRDVEPLEVLSEDMLTTKFVDKNYMVEGYVTYDDVNNVLGKTIKFGIPSGNFVTIGQFYNDEEYQKLRMEEANILLYMLPVKAADALGGQLSPGNRINITFGYKSSATPEEGLDTSKKIITILQYIEIDEVIYTDDEISGIVLKLTHDQYNKLTYAQEYASGIYISKLAENYVQFEDIEENEETFLNGKEASKKNQGIIINNSENDINKDESKKPDIESQKKESDADSNNITENESPEKDIELGPLLP